MKGFLVSSITLPLILLINTSNCIAQPIDLNKIKFKSEEARKKIEGLPISAQKILFGYAPAPTISPEIQRQGLEAGFHRLARKYKFEKASPEWEYHYNRIIKKQDFSRAKRPSSQMPLEHHRFQAGAQFPSQTEIEAAPSPQYIRAAENAKNYRRKRKPRTMRLSADAQQKLIEASVLKKPKCQNSSVAKLAIPEGFLAEKENLDVLFFDGKPPFDVSVAVGKNTEVIIFGDKNYADKASAFGTLPISCLPFKLRSNGKDVIYASGREALKNFDASPEANGTLDPTTRKYLEQEGISE